MRLLLSLRVLKDAAYDMKYYSKLRGFLFGLQKESKAFNKHELNGCKFFCYSNVFPPKDMRAEEQRTLIVSSPSKDFIYWLRGRLSEWQERNKPVEIGELQFAIEGMRSLVPRVGRKARLITGTPIVMRIPKERYAQYGIESERPFEYWKPQHDFGAFLKQLNDNLLKKYNQYYGRNMNEQLFEGFEFLDETCVHRIENGREMKTVGTLWKFDFTHLSENQRKVLQFGLDTGLGELNSSGFGFVNVV